MRLISPRLTRLSGRILSTGLAISLAVLPATGCRTGSSKDRLETTLRQREKEIAMMREDIDRIAGYNLALQTEVRAMRGQTGPSSCDPFTPLYPVRSIVVGRTSTGMDEDGRPGDDAVQVVLETRDGDGKLFRAPGRVQMQVLEVSPEGLKNPIGTYQFNPDEMRSLWKQGLLTSGYVFTLPWQTPPRQEKVRVVASFTMEDGRQFEAEREIRVKPPAPTSLQLVPDAAGGPALLPGSPTPIPLPPGATIIGPGSAGSGELMPGLIPTPGTPSPFPESSSLPFPKSMPATEPTTPGKPTTSPGAKSQPIPPAKPEASPVPAPPPGSTRTPGTGSIMPPASPMPSSPPPVPAPAEPKKISSLLIMPGNPVARLMEPRS